MTPLQSLQKVCRLIIADNPSMRHAILDTLSMAIEEIEDTSEANAVDLAFQELRQDYGIVFINHYVAKAAQSS